MNGNDHNNGNGVNHAGGNPSTGRGNATPQNGPHTNGPGPNHGMGGMHGGGGGMTEEQMMMARMQQGMGHMGGMMQGMGPLGGMSGFGMQGGMMMPSFGLQGGGMMQGGEHMGGGPDMGQNGFPQSEFEMMALLRAKQKLNMNMMNNPLAFNQGYPKQGYPGQRPEDFSISSVMIDKLKRSADHDVGDEEHKGKRRKKAKKPNDMPRRALSAYNIFFSEQREIILKEIEAEEKAKKLKEEGKSEEEIAEILKADKEAAEEQIKKEEGEEQEAAAAKKDEEGKEGDVPDVMNRTFFPARAKRAHRKVHGKIGLVSLAREVSSRWKNLSDEKRKHYQDLAEKDRERHKQVMADYQERKAAENMISMTGSPGNEAQEAPPAPPAENLNRGQSEQEARDSMASQHQQRILFEMMARQQQAQAMGMGNHPGMMGMGGMGGMGGMPGFGMGFPQNHQMNYPQNGQNQMNGGNMHM